MKTNRIIYLILLFCIPLIASAQDEEPKEEPVRGFDKSKLFFGGNFGLSFGNFTLINISPQLGYRFNRTLAAGAGINFQYVSSKTNFNNSIYDYKESIGVGGLNLFGRIYPLDFVFLQLQPELNYTWGKVKYYNGMPDDKLPGKLVPSLLGGGGASIPMGRGAFIVMVQYDILQNERSPYGEKVFYNFGYNFGF